MSDIDLTAAIEAGARAAFMATYPDGDWDSASALVSDDVRQVWLTDTRIQIVAALPELRKAIGDREVVLAAALEAQLWLDRHAYTSIGAPGYFPNGDRCGPCSRFTGKVMFGETATDIEHMRCPESLTQLAALREGNQLAAIVRGQSGGGS